MTETSNVRNIHDDYMVREYPHIKRVKGEGSGRKLMPTCSVTILENYRKELDAINRRLGDGTVFKGAKRARVLGRQERLQNELIPQMERILNLRN